MIKTYKFKTNIRGFIRVEDDCFSEEDILSSINHNLFCTFENESNHNFFSVENYGKIKIELDEQSTYEKPECDFLWSKF